MRWWNYGESESFTVEVLTKRGKLAVLFKSRIQRQRLTQVRPWHDIKKLNKELFSTSNHSLGRWLKSFWGHFDTYPGTYTDQPLFSWFTRAEIVWTWVLLKLVKLCKWNGLMGCSTVPNTWDPTYPTCTRYIHTPTYRRRNIMTNAKMYKRETYDPVLQILSLSCKRWTQSLVKARPQQTCWTPSTSESSWLFWRCSAPQVYVRRGGGWEKGRGHLRQRLREVLKVMAT